MMTISHTETLLIFTDLEIALVHILQLIQHMARHSAHSIVGRYYDIYIKKIVVVFAVVACVAATACDSTSEQVNNSLCITVTESEWRKMLPVIAEYKLSYPDVEVEVTNIKGEIEECKKLSTEIMSGGVVDKQYAVSRP